MTCRCYYFYLLRLRLRDVSLHLLSPPSAHPTPLPPEASHLFLKVGETFRELRRSDACQRVAPARVLSQRCAAGERLCCRRCLARTCESSKLQVFALWSQPPTERLNVCGTSIQVCGGGAGLKLGNPHRAKHAPSVMSQGFFCSWGVNCLMYFFNERSWGVHQPARSQYYFSHHRVHF